MNTALDDAIECLSPTQRQAVKWGDGPALVLAGPGVGKTMVLTVRIARILLNSPKKNFRVLALTFTTKAGDEMRNRVEALVPGFAERTVIGTFHSFCSQILRQHGTHLGIKPDFGVYDQDTDREELLRDALVGASVGDSTLSVEDVKWLRPIDQLRSRLIGPKAAIKYFRDAISGERVARVYEIYEAALRDHNVMDFNGMILNSCRLIQNVPAVASRIQQSYPYWLIDEFQDTSPAQYQFVRLLAGKEFRNVFVVADDDQIIYQWAGASYKQLAAFREQFAPELFQLVENRRCPAQIVQAANNLIAFNSDRTPHKKPLVSMAVGGESSINLRKFATDAEEGEGVAAEVASLDKNLWGSTAVLGRSRAILQPVLEALKRKGIKAVIATRRDRFASPQFVWLQACLDQAVRPTDKLVFSTMVHAASRLSGEEFDAVLLAAQAEAAGKSLMEYWALLAKDSDNAIARRLAELSLKLIQSRNVWRKVLIEALVWLPETAGGDDGVVSDAVEDKAAWEAAASAICELLPNCWTVSAVI